ncbi:MAG: glycosyltransferase family 4 protein [archaeon]|nr:glycosyltransferase family 4 protein [archaeon]
MQEPIQASLCKNLNFHLSVHQTLIDNPPQGVEYSFINSRFSSNDFPLNPINLGYFFNPKEIIHSNGVHVVNKTPWVCDFEDLSYFYGAKRNITNWKLNISKKFFSSPHCKKLIAMSEFAKQSMEEKIKEKQILDKIEVNYPTIPVPLRRDNPCTISDGAEIKKPTNKIPTLIYAARSFERKGGKDVLKVFDALNKKLDFNLIFIGDIPKEIKQKYENNKNIEFFDVLPRTQVQEHLQNSDVFLLPTLADTIPVTIFEAFANQLAVVTTSSKHNPVAKELIEDGKTGMLVSQKENPKPLPAYAKENNLSELIEKTKLLLEDSSLRKNIARNAFNEISSGKFAYNKRIEKLREVYEQALH